jgi:electron transport complex protein RnfB
MGSTNSHSRSCRGGVAAIDAALPQTQCGRCGFAACLPYAEAIAAERAEINRCPPGGAETIANLALLLGREPMPLDPECGEHQPRAVAVVDEVQCVGCARCLPACPVDAIVGARRQLHSILASACTGCERCLDPCPVDCIRMISEWPGSFPSSQRRALASRRAKLARAHYARRRRRLGKSARAQRAVHSLDRAGASGAVQAALARVRSKRARPAENTPLA